MNRKFIKIFSTIMIVLVAIMLCLSLCAIGVAVFGNNLPVKDKITYLYSAFGEFILPIGFFVKGKVGSVGSDLLNTITIASAVAFALLSLFMIKDLVKTFKKQRKAVNNYRFCILYTILLIAIFTTSLVITIMYFNPISKYLKAYLGFWKEMNLGINAIVLKCLIVDGLFILISLLLFISLICCKKQKTVKEVKYKEGLTFYTTDFIEVEESAVQQPIKPAEKQEEKQEVKKPEKKQVQDLVTRIMQLNELKDTGQISEVEYTRLRQKAIKRYKM